MNKKQEYFSISADEVIKTLHVKHLSAMHGLTIVRDSQIKGKINEFLKIPIRTRALVITVCTKGSATLYSNFKELKLVENSVAFIHHGTITFMKGDDDVEFTAFMIESGAFDDNTFSPQITVKLMMEVLSTQLIVLNSSEAELVKQIIGVINLLLSQEEGSTSKEMVSYSLRLFLSTLKQAIFKKIDTEKVVAVEKLTRKDDIFKRFITIASQNYLTERNIEFYAEKLCISPKYLSAVAKESSGATVMEWLNRFIITEAKSMLKCSSKSIMEIADHLNFSTPSAFGKYFKKNTGMTPGEYRNSTQIL